MVVVYSHSAMLCSVSGMCYRNHLKTMPWSTPHHQFKTIFCKNMKNKNKGGFILYQVKKSHTEWIPNTNSKPDN